MYRRISATQLRDSQINTINKLAETMPVGDWHSLMDLNMLEALQHIAYNLHVLADNSATVREDAFIQAINVSKESADARRLLNELEHDSKPLPREQLIEALKRIAYPQ